MITEVLTKDTIRLMLYANNRDEAIELSAEPLLELGKITSEYVTQIKKSIDELGPYIVVIPGIALAHAKPGESVIEECMSLATFSDPIAFGHKSNDPVSVVFTLASQKKDSHLDLMNSLSKQLIKPEFLKMLFTCDNVDEMLNFIRQGENR